ncbi:MAG: TFIIB-type zinc ribbon-containing protein [Bifidobacteriaceae bacterium]|jgi:DNA-directed RNA polymerase subunit RPC12/RpoP|nr:TFIIB-type zinc ribbon-containing protein [Bifidobacteriaceae bacterium]
MSQAIDYKCPRCGGNVGWDAARGAMVCANCGSVYDPAAFQSPPGQAPPAGGGPGQGAPQQAAPAPGGAAQSGAAGWGAIPAGLQSAPPPPGQAPNLAEYSCNSCGAQVVADPTAAAGTCPYCRSPIVITGQVAGELAPDLVIPFRYTRDQAVEALRKLYLGKRLLPKVFSEQNFIDEVKGVYIPFWLFDFDTVVTETYTASRSRSRTMGSKRYTTTQEFLALRQGGVRFWGVPVDGSVNMPDAIMESIEPFDLSQSVRFQAGYLAGFLAERYDLDSDKAQLRARQRLDQTAGRVFRGTVRGYSSVVCANAQVAVKKAVVHYALLPVWMLTTIWRGQRFTFAMNGQTGRMVGDLPLDRKAYWRWLSLLGGGSAVLGAGIALLVGALS